MASAKRGRVEQRKGWIRPEDLPPGRKTIDWWSAFDNDTELTPWTIGRPVAGDNPGFQQQKIFCVNGIAQGAGDGKRTGRRLIIKSIRFTGKMKPPLNPDDITAMAPDFAKISIIYDRKPQWTIPPPDGYSLGQQSMIDSMRRWCGAWEMVNRAGTVCSLPWGYGSSQSSKDEYLIIANEVYELPATYKKLDFGRTLTSTVAEVTSAVTGTYSDDFTIPEAKAIGIYGPTFSTFMGEHGITGLNTVPITGTSQIDERIAAPGSFGLTPVPMGGTIGGTIADASIPPAISTVALVAAETWGPAEVRTLPGVPNTFAIDGHSILEASTLDKVSIITESRMTLRGGTEGTAPDPITYLPVAEITTPAHVITTSATPEGDPPYGPTTNLQRTMPIPLCSPTGILFDVYRSVDLVVEYDSLAAIDSYGAQQITYGALYVGIFTDVNVGWSWEGYVRMTYEDN